VSAGLRGRRATLCRMAGKIAAGLIERGTYDGDLQTLVHRAVTIAGAIVAQVDPGPLHAHEVESPETVPGWRASQLLRMRGARLIALDPVDVTSQIIGALLREFHDGHFSDGAVFLTTKGRDVVRAVLEDALVELERR